MVIFPLSWWSRRCPSHHRSPCLNLSVVPVLSPARFFLVLSFLFLVKFVGVLSGCWCPSPCIRRPVLLYYFSWSTCVPFLFVLLVVGCAGAFRIAVLWCIPPWLVAAYVHSWLSSPELLMGEWFFYGVRDWILCILCRCPWNCLLFPCWTWCWVEFLFRRGASFLQSFASSPPPF